MEKFTARLFYTREKLKEMCSRGKTFKSKENCIYDTENGEKLLCPLYAWSKGIKGYTAREDCNFEGMHPHDVNMAWKLYLGDLDRRFHYRQKILDEF